MTTALVDLEPKPVWKHFDALAAIPRPSTKEAAARNYVVGVATKLGLEAVHDDVGNTVIRKPARPGREAAPMALLQGHLDMVCEKNEGTPHNFDTDPIKLVRDGDWIKADGTTLGSDNGIGVSAALAVMESTDIAHGPLEFVFTIDEETGLTGAAEFPGGLLQSKYFLNLDNEETGTLCIGCSGGMKTMARRKITLKPASAGAGWRIKVSGLKGGHSGVDIHQGRGNALRILGRVLQSALDTSADRDCGDQWRQRAERDSARGICHRGDGSRRARRSWRRWLPRRKAKASPTLAASILACRLRWKKFCERKKFLTPPTPGTRWLCWSASLMVCWP